MPHFALESIALGQVVCREDRCYGLNVCVPQHSYIEALTKVKISEEEAIGNTGLDEVMRVGRHDGI